MWAAPAKSYPDPMGVVRGDVVDAVCRELEKAGDPDRAKGQQAYLKSTMSLRGISAPALKATLRPLLADPACLLTGRDEWEATVRRLWDAARFREERYAALTISGHRLYQHWARDRSAMPLYRHLIESGAWWDLVDEIAVHRVGPGGTPRPSPTGCAPGRQRATCGCAGQPSSASSRARTRPTDNSFSTASRPIWPTGSSSSARQLAGHCVSTPAPAPRRPTGFGAGWTSMATGCHRFRAERPSSTWADSRSPR